MTILPPRIVVPWLTQAAAWLGGRGRATVCSLAPFGETAGMRGWRNQRGLPCLTPHSLPSEGRGDRPCGTRLFGSALNSARRRATAAFTLFEIMIVVGIMMLVAAIGLPAMVRTLSKEGMRKAVSDIMEGCSHARAMAILRATPMELVIRGHDGSITIQPAQARSRDEADGTGPISSLSNLQEPEPKSPMPSFTGHLPDEIAVQMLDVNFHNLMEMDEARIKFHPNGTSDEFTIVLQGPDGEIRKISLEVMTSLPEMEILREAH